MGGTARRVLGPRRLCRSGLFYFRTHMADINLDYLRHSLAHLLGAAVLELWPGSKLTLGPAIENGFYYDIDVAGKVSEEDLPRIEEKMRELLPTWSTFSRDEVAGDAAKERFAGNPYKAELIEEITSRGEPITLYTSGAFTDLCRGGHVDNAQSIDPASFKLTKVAGAYWRGNEKNAQLTRIYGVAFATKQELEQYMQMLEEAERRDHRKLGQELDLFAFSPLVGSGLPLFTPRGTLFRRLLEEAVAAAQEQYGYERVWIPHIAKTDLYKTSGHWDKFEDDLFHVSSKKTEDAFVLKPMNCPHHTQIYASRPRSYRNLPLRYAENTTVYRDENTGQLQGLSRVRSITQDDAHIFCRPDQVKQEMENIYSVITAFYAMFGMTLSVRLSIRDPQHPEQYLGSDDMWQQAEQALKEILQGRGMDYELGEGEAAFYGPKLDFKAKDAIGRDWQLATIQLDFNQPERFGLEYTDADGQRKRPIMIHRAILGSIERFMSIIIEHYAGAFPTWLSPVQIALIPVGEKHIDSATTLASLLTSNGLRVEVDETAESVGKKIRNAVSMKVPYMLVLGDKEIPASGEWNDEVQLMVRRRGEQEATSIALGDFVRSVGQEIRERR